MGRTRLTINPAFPRSRQAGDHPTVVFIAAEPEAIRPTAGGADVIVVPDDQPLHTARLQAAIDRCAASGGGRVVLRPGGYRSGTLNLRSGVTLHLEWGAVLTASPHIDDYQRRETPLGARMLGGVATALVLAENAENIGITGEGTLDGNGAAFFTPRAGTLDWVEEKRRMGLWIPGFDVVARPRPRALVLLVGCGHVRISGVRMVNAASWMVHLLACRFVDVRAVTIRGLAAGANTDGLDLDACSDVRVEDCDIATGDDAIALKNTNSWGLKRPSQRIQVRRCRLASTTHGFTIGTETQDDFEDVVLEEATITGLDGHPVLTGVGLDIVDGGSVRGLRVSDLAVSDAIAPLHVRLGRVGRGQSQPVPGEIRDVRLERIAIRRATGSCLFTGLPGHPLRHLTLREISLEYTGRVAASDVLPTVPELDREFPANEAWRLLPTYGFFCRHIDGLDLVGVAVTNRSGDSRPPACFEDVAARSGTAVSVTNG